MKTPRISDSMNYLDHDLIQEAERERKSVKTMPFLKWGSLAACFCVLIMAAILILPNLQLTNSKPYLTKLGAVKAQF